MLTNKLVTYISQNVPGVDAVAAASAGATNVRKVIPAEYLHGVLQVYNNALTQVFKIVFVMACLTTIGGVAIDVCLVPYLIVLGSIPNGAGTMV